MSLFSGAPAPADPGQHQLEVIADEGVLGGPSYAWRGAAVDCMKGGHVSRGRIDLAVAAFLTVAETKLEAALTEARRPF